MQAFEPFRGDTAPFVVGIAGAIERESDFEHFWLFHRISALEVDSRPPDTHNIAGKHCTREVKSRVRVEEGFARANLEMSGSRDVQSRIS